MQNFLSIKDVDNLDQLVQSVYDVKLNPNGFKHLGKDKTMVLLFLNPSLRTRLSTQKAALNLGMNCIVMNVGQDGWQLEFEDDVIMKGDKAEHVKEAAKVVSQYADIVGMRTFAALEDVQEDYHEKVLSKFVQYASVPVVNMESATVHPLQSLTDLITIKEHSQVERPKVVLSWAPHPKALPQAVSNSFVEWMQSANMDLVITNPEGYDLSSSFVKDTPVIHDQYEAFKNADIIYTKNWSSFEYYGQTLRKDNDWEITSEKMEITNNAKFMHCLPVRRNVVVSDEVIDHPNSLVIQQAANREWAAQGVLRTILEGL